MKKILTIISCAIALMTVASCDWFVLDNQEGYNATVSGIIKDSATGEPVYQEQGSTFNIYEKVSGGQKYIGRDWSAETAQAWSMKSNGTYVNKLVFAGDYYFKNLQANFVCDQQDFVLKEGDNKVDFTVTPYVRIKDVNVSVSGGKIVATCKVESSLPESVVNNIGEVRLCCYLDRFVSKNQNNSGKVESAIVNDVSKDGTQTVELVIDPNDPANGIEFQYESSLHYVRIAALGGHYAIVPAHDEQEKLPSWENLAEWMGEASIDWNAVFAGDLSSVPEKYWLPTENIIHYDAQYKNDGTTNPYNKYNYSPVYKVDLKSGTVTEVTEW